GGGRAPSRRPRQSARGPWPAARTPAARRSGGHRTRTPRRQGCGRHAWPLLYSLHMARASSGTSASVQDYLAAIYDLAGSGQAVIGARLAKHMGISAPAVTEAIHRMVRGNYVKVGRSKELTLTPRGLQVAEVMARRHRLLERWLTDILG